jgi:type IV pilus assembly protein PilW
MHRMKGLTLIELMIAMTLGLISIAAVGWIYLGTIQTYRTHDALSRVQEGARYAFEVIGKDLRMTGVTGCGYSTRMNVIASPTVGWFKKLFEQPIISEEQDGTADSVTEFSDALRVLRADVSREAIVDVHDSGTATITTVADHGLADDAFLIATDCVHAALFQATSVGGKSITHATSGATPANATALLGSPINTSYTYAKGARVYGLSANTYYVDENAAGVPSLFRGTTAGSEELVEGVEDLRVTYGVDSSAPADGETDIVDGEAYLSATEVTDTAALGATVEDRWARVVSIRISLLMRTIEDRVAPGRQTYTYNGDVVEADDLRIRKVFTHVIKLRNR